MPHLVKWNEELSEYGLVVMGSHVQQGSKAQIQAKAASLGITFNITTQTRVQDGNDFSGLPHCMLFDHTGKCVYRGLPAGAEKEMRTTLGKAFADGIDKPGKAIAPHLEALARGQSPAPVLQKVVPLLKSSNADTAEQARKLVENITAGARKKIDKAEAMKEDDPASAYVLIDRVPVVFKGTPVAARANELITALKKDKAVQAELKARTSLESVQKLDGLLSRAADKASIEDLKDARFLKANAAGIDQLKRTLLQMHKSYPEAKATQQALVIGEKYGVTVK
jgi:hypothetical protein